MRLAGRRVLVTGASRGIGAAIARACAAAGASVALAARNREALEKLAADLSGGAYAVDLADPGQVDGFVARVERDGPLDVLVNNAGVVHAGRFVDLAPEQIRELYQVNLMTPAELARQAIPGMVRRGGGHIVNVSSLAGLMTAPGLLPYTSSKAGLSHLTAGLRAELRGLPVATTLVQIGIVRTDMVKSLYDYGPTARWFGRFERLGLLPDIPVEQVASRVVAAIEDGRRHVRLPLRSVAFPMLVEVPRRVGELIATGLDHQSDG